MLDTLLFHWNNKAIFFRLSFFNHSLSGCDTFISTLCACIAPFMPQGDTSGDYHRTLVELAREDYVYSIVDTFVSIIFGDAILISLL